MEKNWIKQGDGYSARVGEYELLVVYSGIATGFQWRVSKGMFGKDFFACRTIFDPLIYNAEQAKEAAEKAYLEHINK